MPREVVIESQFDVHAWIADNYSNTLSAYRLKSPTRLVLKIRGYSFYEEIWAMQEDNLTKYRKAFRVFTSANRRRALEASSGSEPSREKTIEGIVEIDTPKKNADSFDTIRK